MLSLQDSSGAIILLPVAMDVCLHGGVRGKDRERVLLGALRSHEKHTSRHHCLRGNYIVIKLPTLISNDISL